ncbi:hypothetical protein Aau02nite_25360 [Amorphoplanes auranticolor]|uniref:Uncharacterized protein n=1 Tax=Actinoplanes auranticolor TaxID=47988 RepID=A0A919VIF7_9ACTN|nr:hypothetical protein Aau02nite_25360 [Actinoplanes auranticolor]
MHDVGDDIPGFRTGGEPAADRADGSGRQLPHLTLQPGVRILHCEWHNGLPGISSTGGLATGAASRGEASRNPPPGAMARTRENLAAGRIGGQPGALSCRSASRTITRTSASPLGSGRPAGRPAV